MLNEEKYFKEIESNLSTLSNNLKSGLIKIESLLVNNNDIKDFKISLKINSLTVEFMIRDEDGDIKDFIYNNEEFDEIKLIDDMNLYNYSNTKEEDEFYDFLYSSDLKKFSNIIDQLLLDWFIKIFDNVKKNDMGNLFLVINNAYDAYDLINKDYKNDEERFK